MILRLPTAGCPRPHPTGFLECLRPHASDDAESQSSRTPASPRTPLGEEIAPSRSSPARERKIGQLEIGPGRSAVDPPRGKIAQELPARLLGVATQMASRAQGFLRHQPYVRTASTTGWSGSESGGQARRRPRARCR